MRKNRLIFLIFSIIISSCSHLNEFGSRRNNFSIKKIKPNRDNGVYEIIDTTVLYNLISIKTKFDNKEKFPEETRLNPTYLKFYGNGRVGEFNNIDLKDIESLNPKRAKSYLYNYKNDTIVVQVYFTHINCGQCFIKKKVSQNSEILELKSEYSISTYKKVEIPKNYLIYKPDW